MSETVPTPVPFAKRPLLVKGYVVFAFGTGFMATILFFVGIPLQYLAHEGQVDKIVGVIHGVGLYPAYVVLSIAVAFRYRLSIPHMALMALAGLLPGLSIYVSLRTVKHIDAKEAARLAKQAAKARAKAAKANAKKRVPAQTASSAGSVAAPGSVSSVESVNSAESVESAGSVASS